MHYKGPGENAPRALLGTCQRPAARGRSPSRMCVLSNLVASDRIIMYSCGGNDSESPTRHACMHALNLLNQICSDVPASMHDVPAPRPRRGRPRNDRTQSGIPFPRADPRGSARASRGSELNAVQLLLPIGSRGVSPGLKFVSFFLP